MTKLLLPVLAALLAMAQPSFAADTRVFEMRTYYANPGKLDALNARFRDHTLKLFERHGMENIGYWVPVENPENMLVYVVAYPDRAAREASWKAFFADPDWQSAFADSTKDGKLVARVDSRFMTLTDYSPAVKLDAPAKDRLFELRVYHANNDKLDALHRRFSGHTLDLFARHGMENLIYWNLMPDQQGADNTMLYLLAYPDAETREKAWRGFGADPDWRAAFGESINEGRLVRKVDSIIMKPVDYSPMR